MAISSRKMYSFLSKIYNWLFKEMSRVFCLVALGIILYLLYSQPIRSRASFDDVNANGEVEYKYNIFFVESNETRRNLDYKQLCAIESAAKHNPKAKVTLFSIKDKQNFHVLADHYRNIQIDIVNLKQTFANTPLEDWWKNDRLTKQDDLIRTVHLSDALRFVFLYEYGGLYLDLDMYTLATYEDLVEHDSVALYRSEAEINFNNAFVTAGKRHSEFFLACMKEYAETYFARSWARNGPVLLQRVICKFCGIKNGTERQLLVGDKSRENPIRQFYFDFPKDKCNVHLLPEYVAYPYFWTDVRELYAPNATIDIKKFLYSRAVHTTNAFSNAFFISENHFSQIEFFYRFNCPVTFKRMLLDKTLQTDREIPKRLDLTVLKKYQLG